MIIIYRRYSIISVSLVWQVAAGRSYSSYDYTAEKQDVNANYLPTYLPIHNSNILYYSPAAVLSKCGAVGNWTRRG